MFVSMVPPGYTRAAAPLDAPAEAWAELRDIRCDGSGSVLASGDTWVPEHGLRIATGYDDLYHLTPARVLGNCLALGYRGTINHYVGMSHYFRLQANGGGFYASLAGGALNRPCESWHADFAARAEALGYELILSLSYELLDQHCWGDLDPAVARPFGGDELSVSGRTGLRRDRGGGRASGAAADRRAVVVDRLGGADLPLRRSSGGGLLSGADC
jgi:hypothetical protein